MENIVVCQKNITDKKLSSCTSHGVEIKFWTELDGERYLFKSSSKKEPTDIGEVFFSYICKQLGVDCVDPIFCQGKFDEKGTNLYDGIITKSYITKDVVEKYTASEINRFFMENLENVRVNKVDELLQSITYFCTENRYDLDENVIPTIKKMAILDAITRQADRHSQNIEFLLCKGNNHKKIIKLAPLFDNGRCFYFYQVDGLDDIKYPIPKLYFDKNIDTFWGVAKAIIQDKDLYDFYIKIRVLDINRLINEFEAKYNKKIDVEHRRLIVNVWEYSLNKINSIIDNKYLKNKPYRYDLISNDLRNIQDYTNYYYMRYLFSVGKISFLPQKSDFIYQSKMYRVLLTDWAKGLTKNKPNINDFPLIRPMNIPSEILAQINKEVKQDQTNRIDTIKELRQSMVIDYFRIYRIDKQLSTTNRYEPSVLNSQRYYSQEELLFIKQEILFMKFGVNEMDLPSLDGYNNLAQKTYSTMAIEIYLKEQLEQTDISKLDNSFLELAKNYNIDMTSLVDSEEA